MTVPSCPHCHAELPHLRPRYVQHAAMRRVLRLAARTEDVRVLAAAYVAGTGRPLRVGLRAVQRMASEKGLLRKVTDGRYKAVEQL